MDSSILALLAGVLALVLSGLHCFYRRGPHGSQTWEVVYDPTPKGKDVTSAESHDAPGRAVEAGAGVREAL
jgi:hypothetical protein